MNRSLFFLFTLTFFFSRITHSVKDEFDDDGLNFHSEPKVIDNDMKGSVDVEYTIEKQNQIVWNNEIEEEKVNEVEQFDQNSNEVHTNTFPTEETNVEENQSIEETEVSNGLENFQIEEETPELFNSESEDSLTNEVSEIRETDNLEEDDLEIPAFLRRQKN